MSLDEFVSLFFYVFVEINLDVSCCCVYLEAQEIFFRIGYIIELSEL